MLNKKSQCKQKTHNEKQIPYFLADYLHGVQPAQAKKCKIFEKNRCITRTDR